MPDAQIVNAKMWQKYCKTKAMDVTVGQLYGVFAEQFKEPEGELRRQVEYIVAKNAAAETKAIEDLTSAINGLRQEQTKANANVVAKLGQLLQMPLQMCGAATQTRPLPPLPSPPLLPFALNRGHRAVCTRAGAPRRPRPQLRWSPSSRPTSTSQSTTSTR